MLANLRAQLGAARKHSASLVGGRAELFAAYNLNLRPNVQKRKVKPEAAATEEVRDEDEAAPQRPPAPSRTRQRLVATTTEKRSVRPARAPASRRAAARSPRRRPH
jgi:hypothetical protein